MLHDILEDFKGSQDGRLTERFLKGSQRDLSDSLAAVAVKEGWARPVTVAPPCGTGFLEKVAHRLRERLSK